MSLMTQVAELARQRTARDDKFWRKLLYYFELRVPSAQSSGPPQQYLYPLIIPPESYSISEPFAVDRAYTNGGGLFVEEQGIIGREITLSGTTGFAPRRQPRETGNASAIALPRHRTFERAVTRQSSQAEALSGQRHFQFLQDTVFRTYGDLKQDPATSEGTELYFHVVKDDEHWRVFPLSFRMERAAGKNTATYEYTIQLLAVRPSSFTEAKFSEDKPVTNALRDVFTVLNSAAVNIRAGLQDVGLVMAELQAANSNFVGLFEGAASVASSVEALVAGTATLIASPYNLLQNTLVAGDAALAGWHETSAIGPPANIVNSIRGIIDNLEIIGSYPSQFRDSIRTAVDKFQSLQSLLTSRQLTSLVSAAQASAPSSLRSAQNSTTAPRPGDLLRAQAELGLGRNTPRFTSAVEYVIEQGDSLATLAARYLGDARWWKYIAIFNDLRPPFISNDGVPGTLRVGDKVLIPSFGTPPTVQSSPATYGVRLEDPAAVQTLGRDLLMSHTGQGLYDLVIDAEGGSVDVKSVSGIDNLKQALRTRVITERGTDLMYRGLGCERIIGLGLSDVDYETAQVRLLNAVQEDPRIAGVRSCTFDTDQPDAVTASIEAEVRGFVRPERITVTSY